MTSRAHFDIWDPVCRSNFKKALRNFWHLPRFWKRVWADTRTHVRSGRPPYFFFDRKVEYSPGWGLGLDLCVWPEEYTSNPNIYKPSNTSLMVHFIYGKFFVKLPLSIKPVGDDMLYKYGISYYSEGRAILASWGEHSKFINMPWSWEFLRHTIWDVDGNDVSEILNGVYDSDTIRSVTKAQEFDYVYVRNSGEVQNRKAYVYVEEREWRWRWFMKLPWPRMIKRCIDVSFSEEIGERVGSWKGGCISCGYDLKPGETAQQCLQRMELERKFK